MGNLRGGDDRDRKCAYQQARGRMFQNCPLVPAVASSLNNYILYPSTQQAL